MRLIKLFLISFIMLIANQMWAQKVWDGTLAAGFESGMGTKDSPFEIQTPEQFAFFINAVNNGETFYGKEIVMTRDISLCDMPLGAAVGTSFSGTFNGMGHYIYDMYCMHNYSAHMFYNLEGTICNLAVQGKFYSSWISSFVENIKPFGIIYNCKFEIDMNVAADDGLAIVANTNNGTIVDCQQSGTITCSKGYSTYYNDYDDGVYFGLTVEGSGVNISEADPVSVAEWEAKNPGIKRFSFDYTQSDCTIEITDPEDVVAAPNIIVRNGITFGGFTLPTNGYDCTITGYTWRGKTLDTNKFVNREYVNVYPIYKRNIKKQPTTEDPTIIVDDIAHAKYDWYKLAQGAKLYEDWSYNGTSYRPSTYYYIKAEEGDSLTFDYDVRSTEYKDYLKISFNDGMLVSISGNRTGRYKYYFASAGTYPIEVRMDRQTSNEASASVRNIRVSKAPDVWVERNGKNVLNVNNANIENGESYYCMVSYTNTPTTLRSNPIIAEKAPKVPDTNISDIANTIYFDNAEAFKGREVTLSVKMKNTIEPTGFQFDLYLPEGVSVVQDADGFCDVALSTERTTTAKTNTFDSAILRDGALRVLAASTKNYVFSGNDGEVCTIKLMVDESLEPGDYSLILKNIEMTNNAGGTWSTEHIKRTLTVVDYTIGDVNADTKINVGDFSAIASHIMGETPAGFVEMAADVNNDSKINVGDLSGLVTIIMNGGEAQSRASARRAKSISVTDVSELDNVIYPSAFTVAPGTDAELIFNMKNNFNATGFQFDFTLPEGMYVPENEDGFLDATLSTVRTTTKKTNTFECGHVGNNTYRILVASTRNYEYEGNDGEVVRVRIHADESMSEGSYALNLTDITLTDAHGATYDTDKLVAALTVGTGGFIDASEFDAAISDGENYTLIVKLNCKSITYTRTFSTSNVNHWVALYVPMSIDVEAYADKFDIAQIYAFCSTVDTNGDGSVDADDENFLFVQPKKTGCTVANVPYVIRPKAAGECVINSADNVLYPAENGEVTFSTSTDLFTVRGLYEPFTVTAGDNNYYVSGTGALNIRTEGSTTVKANRWIMHRDMRDYGSSIANGKSSQASYRIVALGEDMDEATAIKMIEGERPQQSNDMFTLDGRKVQDASSLMRGVYIMNGKKVWIR